MLNSDVLLKIVTLLKQMNNDIILLNLKYGRFFNHHIMYIVYVNCTVVISVCFIC